MARSIPEEKWLRYWQLRQGGATPKLAARGVGISFQAAKDFENRKSSSSGAHLFHLMDDRPLPAPKQERRFDRGPIPLDELCAEARRALNDFGYFRRRYFGNIATPWQEETAHRVVDLLATPDEEYVVANAPPGGGKSTFVKDLAAWLTVRDRAIRGLFGSASQNLATTGLGRLRRDFERQSPARAKPKEIAEGVAADAEATLWEDFGRFRPEKPERWKANEFIVEQHGGVSIDEKESTWTAFGRDSAQLGNRYEFIVWDDLPNNRNTRSADTREALFEWWDTEAESRLEPGGLLILLGQRVSSVDLYRRCLDLRDEEDRPVYHHIAFKAHYDENCPGDGKHAEEPYPAGCLLDPKRLPWKKLSPIRRNTPNRYAVWYQQEDAEPDSTLVNPLWVSGGVDTRGVHYPGCYDVGRQLWELPRGLASPLGVVTADPSPSRYWAVQAWVVVEDEQNPALGGLRYLLDMENRVMEAPDLLDWNYADQRFFGLLEDWWHEYQQAGVPLSYVVVETNAAQRFLLQYDHARRWARLRNVQFVEHKTHSRNKLSEDLGVPIVGPHWQNGRVRLPGHANARIKVRPLVEQVTHWTHSYQGQDDQVMANWFLEAALPALWMPPSTSHRAWRPSWLRRAS